MKTTTWVVLGFLGFSFLIFSTSAMANQEETALNLTTLLRSARSIVSSNKKLIGDPVAAGFDVNTGLAKVREGFKKNRGRALAAELKLEKKLLTSIERVFKQATAGNYKKKWPEGKFANKFLPARFAREAAHLFTISNGGKAILKVTAPNALLVNPKNKADKWESDVLETKFKSASWKKGKFYAENVNFRGRKAYRLILPEYYGGSCMGCHGAAGTEIHAGKIAGKEGQLGGAISVVLF